MRSPPASALIATALAFNVVLYRLFTRVVSCSTSAIGVVYPVLATFLANRRAEPSDGGGLMLRATDLSYQYPSSSVPDLKAVSLDIRGQMVVRGPTGSGKSTCSVCS